MKHRAYPDAPYWVRAAAALLRRLPAARYRLMSMLPRPGGPFWMRMPPDLGGWRFLCRLQDSISREVCFTGRYEPQETALLCGILKPGMTFVDVGANWGYHTLLAASLVGRTGRVLSLEPDPRLFPILKENAARNRFDQVQALPAAAAERSGTATLQGFLETDGNYGLSRLDADQAPGPGWPVPTRALDELLDELAVDAVDLLKMDIEGGEGRALDGLKRALAARRIKRILLELHPAQLAQAGRSAAGIMTSLGQAGYQGWLIDHSRAASRRSAYASPRFTPALMSLDPTRPLAGDWPHVLLTLPSYPPPGA